MLESSEMLLRIVTAAGLGSLIGFERERLNWAAGLRTHMLVCLGAAVVMLVSQYGFSDVLKEGTVILDPSRVAAQVVSGIGFIGAGTILFLKTMIRGLTTAASLWVVAAVGLAVGGGLYITAVASTALVLFILAGIRPIERHFLRKSRTIGLKVSIKKGRLSFADLEDHLRAAKLDVWPSKLEVEIAEDVEIINVRFESISQERLLNLMDEIKTIPGVERVEFT